MYSFRYARTPPPETHRRRRMRRRIWVFVFLKRVVKRLCGGGGGRRRRRVLWGSLWARRVRRGHYDCESYKKNFDEGSWKEEEEDFWGRGSFAFRFGVSTSFVHGFSVGAS
ncbi:hypothetical protein QJS04_geneDACA010410 [Acorus gramineus]|uniref:Uncharacterized protein n=1 Tax=Acorus gramineus TaxID=55184 RepID=A0AAV9A449_ACOGR|nr:hypothetical protein QJS04_geneDACA010410 [Acorus gramineus]